MAPTHFISTSSFSEIKFVFMAYIDDILINSNTWEEYISHLAIVFERLREAGLTVKEKKCTFWEASSVYLGYVVGSGTIRPMQGKVMAIGEFGRPKMKRDVRSFLGMCGYYQIYINNFSTVATPLSNLAKKHAPNKLCGRETVKNHLSS